MLRFLTDENFHGPIVRGLLLRRPGLDLVRVQDVDLNGASDPEVLAWAADHDRIVLTRDYRTMPDHANARIAAVQPMPGLFVVNSDVLVRQAIEELLLTDDCSEQSAWVNQILRFPLRG